MLNFGPKQPKGWWVVLVMLSSGSVVKSCWKIFKFLPTMSPPSLYLFLSETGSSCASQVKLAAYFIRKYFGEETQSSSYVLRFCLKYSKKLCARRCTKLHDEILCSSNITAILCSYWYPSRAVGGFLQKCSIKNNNFV